MSYPALISKFLPRRSIWLLALAAALGVILTAACSAASGLGAPAIKRIPVPGGGIQPQAVVDGEGTIHLVYYKGDAARGDLFYVKSGDQGASFSAPVPVNGADRGHGEQYLPATW